MHTSFAEMHLFWTDDGKHFRGGDNCPCPCCVCTARNTYSLDRFCAACPSVNHSWTLCAIDRAELPQFICRFLRSISNDSTTHVEFAGAIRGQLIPYGQRSKTRVSSERLSVCNGLRPPSLDGSKSQLSQRNPDDLDFLQPAQCACADDLAVAASSFRDLMTALALAFHSVWTILLAST